MNAKTQDERLVEVGESAMGAIRNMVAALECDYERLEELRDERDDHEAGPIAWAAENPEEALEFTTLLEAASGDDPNYPCTDREQAEQRILEDALSAEVRSDWTTPGGTLEAAEYRLLLTTGGPAVRIIGELTDGEATSARLEVQDWGTPWTEHITTGSDHEALLSYARCFFFGD